MAEADHLLGTCLPMWGYTLHMLTPGDGCQLTNASRRLISYLMMSLVNPAQKEMVTMMRHVQHLWAPVPSPTCATGITASPRGQRLSG